MARVIARAGRIGISFLLSTVVLGLIFYGVKAIVLAQVEPLSETAQEIAAWQLEAQDDLGNKRYAEAADTYAYIIQQYPGTEAALSAHINLARLYQALGQDDPAVAAYAALLDEYGQRQEASQAVCDAAEDYRFRQEFQRAHDLYADILDHCTDANSVFVAQKNIILTDVELAGDPNSGADLETDVAALVRNFAGDERLAREACLLADTLCERGEYGNAGYLYKYVTMHHPNDEHALWSQKGITMAAIRAGNDMKAVDGIEGLLTNFAADERIANAACQIADAFRKRGKHEMARGLYAYVLRDWPNAEHALWSRMGSVISDIALGNDLDAAESTQRLLSDYSQDERLANAACQIGDMYQKSGRFREAQGLYQYVVANWPAAEHAIWSQKGLAVTEIFDTTDPNGYPALDKLLTDFREHPLVPLAAFLAAEAYRDEAMSLRNQGRDAEAHEAYLRMAGALERTIGEAPASVYTPESYYLLAECHHMTGRLTQAIACHRYIADTWPDWERAWCARFQEGRGYERLKQAGSSEAAEADRGTENAYRQLLTDYPGCPASTAAAGWLTRHGK